MEFFSPVRNWSHSNSVFYLIYCVWLYAMMRTFVSTNHFYGYKPDMQPSRGCFGCCTKPPIVISVEDRSKGLKIQGRQVRKKSLREDFWSSSACEMDNSAFPSHRSASSISTSNHTFDPICSTGTTNNHSEFVNNGKCDFISISFRYKILGSMYWLFGWITL